MLGIRARHILKREHNQRVTDEQRNALIECSMYRGAIAAKLGVVETRQIVVDQRRTMQQLDGSCRRFGKRRLRLAATCCDGEAQTRTDPRSARKNSVADGSG
jgi:hypothetical protein